MSTIQSLANKYKEIGHWGIIQIDQYFTAIYSHLKQNHPSNHGIRQHTKPDSSQQ
jgi:hypothetical protein